MTENTGQEMNGETVVEDVEETVSSEDARQQDSGASGEWFIIQTYSGQENKVKRSLEQRIAMMSLQARLFEILIPEEDIIEVKNNKKVESKKKMYPGYIFVRMIFDDELWYMMKRIPGLSKFMGNQKSPLPVKDDEMLKVLRQVGVKVQKYQIDFEVGDMVKIIAGPFRGYSGPVKEINAEKGKLKSMLLIFGRETPVEIDFDQVEKASK
ncbi:MAG: transcription termination/antitermination protein NusG [Candidatus Margulisiibacteriota bacterium]